ncbi:MAG TPA: endonuclease/exonuclease/phosphatase family protein [Opitutus sp.]|nr:endonuclease/exonuclease/phosphatase family protein [Opitutus sp.]
MRIATLNVQNLRLREDAGGPHFDGARDEIMPLSKLSAEARALDREDRRLTARLIADADADILALQEVFDQRTLDAFHDAHLAPLGAPYPHRICIPGNDGRRHVALMSRLPLQDVQSHAAMSYADIGLDPPEGDAASARVFRRDCLAASCAGVQLYVVHFKAPSDPVSLSVVRREALSTRKLIERRFADPAAALWLILGDVNVNDVPTGDVIDVLTTDFAHDLAAALPAAERWTYFHPAHISYARPDRMLASPLLAARCGAVEVRREGISRAAEACAGPRLAGVGVIRPRASDHALLAVDVHG